LRFQSPEPHILILEPEHQQLFAGLLGNGEAEVSTSHKWTTLLMEMPTETATLTCCRVEDEPTYLRERPCKNGQGFFRTFADFPDFFSESRQLYPNNKYHIYLDQFDILYFFCEAIFKVTSKPRNSPLETP